MKFEAHFERSVFGALVGPWNVSVIGGGGLKQARSRKWYSLVGHGDTSYALLDPHLAHRMYPY